MEIVALIFLACVFAIGGILVVGFIVARLQFPGQLAQIEQLRRDSAKVQASASHEVMGQVAKCNQAIASAKRYRALWWSGWLVPKGWDDVQEISMPSAEATRQGE